MPFDNVSSGAEFHNVYATACGVLMYAKVTNGFFPYLSY